MAAAGTGAVASAPTPPQRAGGARPSDLCSTPRVRAGEIEHLQPARRRLSPLPSLFPRPLTGGAGAYLSSGSTRSSAACGATRVHAAICHRQSILLITASLCRHIRPRGSPPLHHLIKIHAGLPESSWPCRPVGPNRHLAKPSSSPEFHKPHRPPPPAPPQRWPWHMMDDGPFASLASTGRYHASPHAAPRLNPARTSIDSF